MEDIAVGDAELKAEEEDVADDVSSAISSAACFWS